MGRSPCCSKVGLNRGVWTSAEDKILIDYILLHGEGRWRSLPKNAGLKRCGKSCRLRWLNYLRPDIKRGNISKDEEDLIVRLHKLLGNRWSLIAGRLPGRTDNEIKNYWNTTLRKKARLNRSGSTLTKQNNMKKKDKMKRETNQDTQTPAVQCTETELLITGSKPKDYGTNVLEPNKPSMLSSKDEPYGDKMYADLPALLSLGDTGFTTNEAVTEPQNDNQLTLSFEPRIDSNDHDFSGLYGIEIYSHAAENEIKSTWSSSDEGSIMAMLEELWNAENMIIEPDLDSPSTDILFASTSD